VFGWLMTEIANQGAIAGVILQPWQAEDVFSATSGEAAE